MTKSYELAQLAVFLLIQTTTVFSQEKPYPKPQVPFAAGKSVPDFKLKNQNGNDFRLSDQRGHWVLLYFYRGYW
jgi:cytochrome oxidase Cu insertion factor (SCO1/SenC/PrrC family)